jgi:hypothetical protein
MTYQAKHTTKKAAITDAKKQSAENRDTIYSIIAAEGVYFVEEGTAFVRNNEKLVGEYLIGMKLKP